MAEENANWVWEASVKPGSLPPPTLPSHLHPATAAGVEAGHGSDRRPSKGGTKPDGTPHETSAAEQDDRVTVLVADDEPAVRGVVTGVLEMEGYKVLVAGTAMEAVEICQTYQGPIHLLVSDVMMPQMKGPELAFRLAFLRPTMKLLYISGYATDAIENYDFNTPFLAKPFSIEALKNKVRDVLTPQPALPGAPPDRRF